MKNLIRIINNIILCIRFPFLFPRNRFTGLHYNNWSIIEFHRKYYQFLYDHFIFQIIKESEIPEGADITYFKDIGKLNNVKSMYRLGKTDNSVYVIDTNNSKISHHINISDFLESGEVIKVEFIDGHESIVVSDDAIVKEDFCRFITVDKKETILKNVIKILDWVNDYPLQWLHCIPKYTELDAMETGWRKAFGIQFCKDLKKQLKKEGRLYSFRITQLKEKWGLLRMYHNGSNEIDAIVDKYEELSEKVCIRCGKPATKATTGWISYYCDSCYPRKKEVKEENQDA